MTELTGDPHPKVGFWCWLFLLTILAASLRLYKLDSASFWIDELFTVRDAAKVSQRPWFDVFLRGKALGHAPTAAWLSASGVDLKSVTSHGPSSWQALGIHEAGTRAASCLIGILSVPVLGLLSVRLLGVRAAGLMTFFLAISPWHIYWSQAARFYSAEFLFYNLALVLYFLAARRRSLPLTIACCIFLELAILTQPTAFVLGLIVAGDWALARILKTDVGLPRIGYGLLGVTFAYGFVVTAPNFVYDLWDIAGTFAGAANNSISLAPPSTGNSPLWLAAKSLFFVGPLTVLFATLTAWALRKNQRRLLYDLLLSALVPIVVFALLAARPYAGSRYTFVCLYAWLALASLGADQIYCALRPRFGIVFAYSPVWLLSFSMLLSNANYFFFAKGFHPRIREACAYVAQHKKSGDKILVSTMALVPEFYLGDPNVQLLPPTRDLAKAIDQPAWLIVYKDAPEQPHPVDDIAILRARYDVWNMQPMSSVNVYYFDGSAEVRNSE